jgi:hypothetical protein
LFRTKNSDSEDEQRKRWKVAIGSYLEVGGEHGLSLREGSGAMFCTAERAIAHWVEDGLAGTRICCRPVTDWNRLMNGWEVLKILKTVSVADSSQEVWR